MQKSLTIPAVIGLAAAAAACSPTNPFDPATAPEHQQPGKVVGSIFGLRVPVDGVVAAGLCDLGDDQIPDDNAGFQVALRPLADDPELGLGVQTAETNASGKFEIKNIPPGRYSFEVFGDGFDVPPPVEITVLVGETLTRTLCALDAQAPAAPTLAPLPTVVDGAAQVAVTIVGPEPGVDYTVTETPAGGAPTATTVTAADNEDLVVPLGLVQTSPARTSFLIEVTARDALGNRSAPTDVAIVRDAVSPPAPAAVRVSAALDRVFVDFDRVDATEDDDGAASYFVSYGVTARPEDDAVACPFGVPLDDAPDDAFFAVEGPSPIATPATQLTLSGLTPGTELFVYVAAVDAAGNRGCFSPPARVRPDVVTFARLPDRGPSLPAARAIAFLPGSSAGSGRGGYAVAADGGTLVVDALGVSHDVATEAADAAVAGDELVLAAGLLGVARVPLDAAGVPGDATTNTLGTATAVAGEPGLLWAATDAGLFAGETQVTAGSFFEVKLAGALVLAVRAAAGGKELVALDRGAGFAARGAPVALADAPLDLAVVDRSVVLAEGQGGVRAVSFAACLPAGAPADCLRQTARRPLPAGETPISAAALDDVALVGTAEGSVFALALPSLQPLGRISFGAPVLALVRDDLGFCASLDAAGGAAPVLACASVAGFPLDDGEQRVSAGDNVFRVAVAGGRVVAGAGSALVDAPLASLGGADDVASADGALVTDLGGEVKDVAPFGDDALAVTADGRLFLARAGRAPVEAHDLGPDLAAFAEHVELPLSNAFIVVTGGRLVLGVCGDGADDGLTGTSALVTGTVAVDAAGAVTVAIDDGADLNGIDTITDVLVHAGRAYVSTAPLGVFAIDLDPLVVAADTKPPETSGTAFAGTALLAGDPAAPSILVPTRSADGVDGFGALDGTGGLVGVLANTPTNITGGVRAGRFLAVTTFGDGAFLLAGQDDDPAHVFSVVAFPSVADVQEAAVSARGLVFADGAGGIVRVRLR